jgi:hypothetical protein
MTKHDIDAFRVILKAKQADASRTLQSRERVMIEKSADQLDEIERTVARDVAIKNVDWDPGCFATFGAPWAALTGYIRHVPPPIEDQLYLFGASSVQIFPNHVFEEGPSPNRTI